MRNVGRRSIVALAAMLAACSGAPATPTSPSGADSSLAVTAGQLAGTWTLTSVQLAGQPAQPAPAGARYTLTLTDGRLSTRADCNTCSAAFSLSGATLTTSTGLACTRAACPTMGFESAYTAVLAGEHTVMLIGNTLLLSSARGVLSFVA
jgi:heat shock protein HslJ